MEHGARHQSAGSRLADLASRLRLPGRSGRANPGPGGFLALVAVAVLVALVVGGWVLSSQPHRIQVAAAVEASGTGVASPARSVAAAAGSPGPAGGGPVVDVVGKVRRPGVYRLGSGARVQDALTAAGGMLPGVDRVSVNLARRLTDGEQVVIGLPPAAGPAAGASSGSPGSAEPVDLNTATEAQLDGLPGVGPVLAQRIVDWRSQHGRFGSVDDLSKVSGIGEAKLADLKPLVTVS